MKTLAIETSCEHATVALLNDGALIQLSLEGHVNHSERLLPAIHGLLAEAGYTLSALDLIAFGAGPGAFTGLRLACGVAQGLAMGAGLGVVPVNSLAALALQTEATQVFVATDARMGEVYTASYQVSQGLPEEVSPPCCCRPEALALPPAGEWFAIGSAFRAYESVLDTFPPARLLGVTPDAFPRAGEVACIAEHEARQGRLLDPELAGPLYVRNKVALTTQERLARGGKA